MTRKRFIKLAMSHGMPRNEARRYAEEINQSNVPYRFAYSIAFFEVRFGPVLRAIGMSIAETIKRLNETDMNFKEFMEKVKQEESK